MSAPGNNTDNLSRKFIPGLELCGLFYFEAIRPVLDIDYPGLRYSAALLGSGSEVLGFDTEESTDHNWGPRLMLFLAEEDHARLAVPIHETMRRRLPRSFRGYPTSYVFHPDEIGEGSLLLQDIEDGPINHRVDVLTVRSFVESLLGIDPNQPVNAADWLTFPQQRLLELTGGRVYRDDLGQLEEVRHRFAYYPHDVWLYLVAAQWRRIAQTEAFVGRAGFVGDDLGSSLVASHLVQDVMMLCFLMEKRFAPYAKWFGTAFSHLACAPELAPLLGAVLRSQTWQEREDRLAAVYSVVAVMHNALNITRPLDTEVTRFHNRPYRVIHGDTFYEAIREQIADPSARVLPPGAGGVDQVLGSADILTDPAAVRRLGRIIAGGS